MPLTRLADFGLPEPKDQDRIDLLRDILIILALLHSRWRETLTRLQLILTSSAADGLLSPGIIPYLRGRIHNEFDLLLAFLIADATSNLKTAAQHAVDSVQQAVPDDKQDEVYAALIMAGVLAQANSTGLIDEPLTAKLQKIVRNTEAEVNKRITRGSLTDEQMAGILAGIGVILSGQPTKTEQPTVNSLAPNLERAVADEYAGVYAETQVELVERLPVNLKLRYNVSAAYRDSNCNAHPKCGAFDGELYAPADAKGIIPRHRSCYCFWSVEPA